jgi:hypothetical protein
MKTSEFILHTLPVLEAKEGVGTITYLEPRMEKAEKGRHQITSLAASTKFFQLESYQVSSLVQTEILKDLEFSHGIKGESFFIGVLENELTQLKDKKTYEKFKNLGVNQHKENLTPWKKWTGKIFKNLKFYSYLGPESKQTELVEKLASQVVLRSHLIAAKTRRGAANFLICNSRIGSYLSHHPSFTHVSLNGKTTQNSGEIYPIGVIFDRIKVFVNPRLTWNDTSIVLGRKCSENEPGIYFVEKEPEVIEIQEYGTPNKRITIKQRMAWVEAGNTSTNYFTFDVQFKNKPLWRRITKL